MSTGAVVVLIVVILVIVVVVSEMVIIRLRRQKQVVQARWTAEGATFRRGPELANYQGLASVSVPLRGTGVLALTDSDLRFARALPRREFRVSLDQIVKVEKMRSWHGSYRAGQPVLVVSFRNDAPTAGTESEDAIGFIVRDAPGWLDAIAQAAGIPVSDQQTDISDQP